MVCDLVRLLAAGINGDLWSKYEFSRSDMLVDKVKAHRSLSDVRAGLISSKSFVGNFIADDLASAAAELSALPEIERRQADHNLALCYCLCRRLAVLEHPSCKLKMGNIAQWSLPKVSPMVTAEGGTDS